MSGGCFCRRLLGLLHVSGWVRRGWLPVHPRAARGGQRDSPIVLGVCAEGSGSLGRKPGNDLETGNTASQGDHQNISVSLVQTIFCCCCLGTSLSGRGRTTPQPESKVFHAWQASPCRGQQPTGVERTTADLPPWCLFSVFLHIFSLVHSLDVSALPQHAVSRALICA